MLKGFSRTPILLRGCLATFQVEDINCSFQRFFRKSWTPRLSGGQELELLFRDQVPQVGVIVSCVISGEIQLICKLACQICNWLVFFWQSASMLAHVGPPHQKNHSKSFFLVHFKKPLRSCFVASCCPGPKLNI